MQRFVLIRVPEVAAGWGSRRTRVGSDLSSDAKKSGISEGVTEILRSESIHSSIH